MIKYIQADQQFDPVLTIMKEKYDFEKIIAPTNEHVPTVERSIRTVKERERATLHGNPYKELPRVLIKSVLQECTRKLNFFPAKGSCSVHYIPREIMHHTRLNYKNC
jgi:hypothetical protein